MITPEDELSKLPLGVKEEILISKYDTFINYIKQLNLHLSVACRNSANYRQVLKTLLNQLDKIVDDYNSYLLLYTTSTPLYFNISSLAFRNKEPNLHSDFKKAMIIQNHDFSLHFVFLQWKKKKIRFHVQIWKKSGSFRNTNSILTKLENLFARELLQSFMTQGYFNYNDANLILTNKRQRISTNFNRIIGDHLGQDVIIAFMLKQGQQYLNQLTKLFSAEEVCCHCNKYTMFDSKNKIFEPPIIQYRTAKEEKKYFHQPCFLKIFIPKRDNR